MARTRVSLNSKAVQGVLKSDGVRAELNRQAQVIEGRLPDGYVIVQPKSRKGRRARVRIVTGTWDAQYDNLKRNSLLKALGGGGR